jgi:hypothetical protein
MAERDASITLATTQLERALEIETSSSITAAQTRSALAETIHAFRGLTIQVRPTLAALGLEPPLIPSELDGRFAEVIGWIGSLPKQLRQVLRTEGENVVNLVGKLILMCVHRFAPNFPFMRIFKRFGDDADGRVAKETA